MLRLAKIMTLVGLAALAVAIVVTAYVEPKGLLVAYLVATLVAFCYWVFEDLEERLFSAVVAVLLMAGPFVIGTGQLVTFIGKVGQWSVSPNILNEIPLSQNIRSSVRVEQKLLECDASQEEAPEYDTEKKKMSRVIELAEERLRIAEELGLSVASFVAVAIAGEEDGDPGMSSNAIAEMDARINEARQNPKNYMPIAEVKELLTSIDRRLAAIEQALLKA